ncbi:AMP-binding protein [Ascidiaceihabitans sp.]|uniref:class I adenylate-forming enzyme family protein n=1 Tax=Ascidiaceihabitans sp. TaxID=1872644 RepID=UPI003299C9E3
MNLGLWLARMAQKSAAAPALFLGETLVARYDQFHDAAACFGGWLKEQGVRPGDRVAVFMPNVPQYLIALYGIWYAGAVAVPINAKLHGQEAAYILDHSDCALAICAAAQTGVLQKVQTAVPVIDVTKQVPQGEAIDVVSRNRDDLAWLFYTSGTTGRPKGVQITHGMLMAMAYAYQSDVDQVTSEDATIYAAPMSHGAGLYAVMHVQKGARHVCPASAGFEAQEVLDLADYFGRAHMFAAPTIVTRLTAHAQATGQDGRGLRTIVYAGTPMYVADILKARSVFGDVFVQIYGQGECPMAITVLPREDLANDTHPEWAVRLASVGRAQSCVEVAIGDAQGQVLPVGTQGEIMVRGAPVMPGYWRNRQATDAALRDGWLMTGDIGVLDACGYLTLKDRSKDMIISGGSNIYPREVEEVLLQHSGVVEASVVGRRHPDWGEEVVAFVVGHATQAELDATCRASIANFKAPKAYVFVDALPKNNYGKVLKTELRDRLMRRS